MSSQIKFVLACLAIIASLGSQAQSQVTPAYFRYFAVAISNLSQDEINQYISKEASNTSFVFQDACPGKSILIKVRADYPKRIDDIEEELSQALKVEFGPDRVQSVENISVEQKTNFCK